MSDLTDAQAAAAAAAAALTAAQAALADAQAAAQQAQASAATASAAAISDLRVSSDGRGIIQFQTSDGVWHDSTLTAAAFLAGAQTLTITDSNDNPGATVTGSTS